MKELGFINKYLLQWLGVRLAVNDDGHWSLILGVSPGSGWGTGRFRYFIEHCPRDFHGTP